MSVCRCGRTIRAGSSLLCDRCAALLVLGLAHGATDVEIKDAYRTLAKVWHPDRFQTDQRLRLKAEAKLQEINSAYQLLTTAAESTVRPTSPAESRHESKQTQAKAPSASQGATHARPSTQTHPPGSAKRQGKTRLVLTLAILVAGGIWIALRYERLAAPQPATSATANDAAVRPTANPVSDNSGTKAGNSAAAAGQQATGAPRQRETTNDAARPKQGASRANEPRASLVVYPPDDPRVPYFTVGSTKNDVVRVQGPPSQATDTTFSYGLSQVYFKNGRVQSWRMDPGSPLKAWVAPQ